jgi:hypothetical protein
MQKYRKFGYLMKERMLFTNEERALLVQKDFFILKKAITGKLMDLFGLLNNAIMIENQQYRKLLPEEVFLTAGKISKGENYRGFPWMVLDSPRIFNKTDVFAFRSMCWWGNEISFTLHLSGKYKALIVNPSQQIKSLDGNDLFINVNDTPWEYHFEENNYLPITKISRTEEEINRMNFIKISKKLSLKNIDDLVKTGSQTYCQMINALFNS